jgi:hypothetical protein
MRTFHQSQPAMLSAPKVWPLALTARVVMSKLWFSKRSAPKCVTPIDS